MGASKQDGNRRERGSGTQRRAPEPRYLVVGRVLRPHGVRGELRVEVLTDFPEHLAQHSCLYLGPDAVPYPLKQVRVHKGAFLLKLEGCDDRDSAEELRGLLVQIPAEEAVELEEGEYYHHQLVGLDVEASNGEWLGTLVEILDLGVHDVYVVMGPQGEFLLPAFDDVVLEVDLDGGRMVVEVPRGLGWR